MYRGKLRYYERVEIMTRKDYEIIAGVFRIHVVAMGTCGKDNYAAQFSELAILAEDMASALTKDNPRFNRETFIAACGFARVK